MPNLIEVLTRFLPLLTTLAAVIVLLGTINWFLRRRWRDDPGAQFRFQLIMPALSFAALEEKRAHLAEQLKAGEAAIKARGFAEKDSGDTSD
jgi:hypothetical protein